MSSHRIIEFHGIKLCVNEQVYEPADDTELILDMINVSTGEKVIDVGSGTGILGIYTIKRGAKVVFIDINPYAVEATLCSLRINGIDSIKYDIVNCDLLTCLRSFKFDTIVFNPPYLPFEEYDKWIGYSWSGGKDGSEVILRFLKIATARRIYLVFSSLSNEDLILSTIENKGYSVLQKREKVFGYERIVTLELIKYVD
ncbi:methyltransferase [Sulfolobus sp. A20]|uniref:HemK2/MTQ2 family protein methyltransferase n=1 Tax=Sulfolobaceae TaxID=118883 RepID=UPI000845EB9E|nr:MULTISPECIES: HemK2/MTQ2 family protein methyltransferase [unclassified Sulfolobus]TRM74600.1 methyltransferase [Sulfolobus sp. B5]TRM78315.1 methyltransferase [Sulfolobus sp. A20-N-F8]TRM80338.1 methyltransferase [Sulfolobus sp. D5]TRM84942.1 methyltransferase [Sulfolobus sp. F3]TRM88082.1 methyltransferase [Sulfolobus sp. C3]TRM97767.1 methyltransferase [Sulfolobus sp. F1]TRN00110.1 methyltransferase [Sulfolobus sp. E1]